MPSFGGYQGSVLRIPLGTQGLTYSKNPSLLPPSSLLQAESVTYSDDSIEKMSGRAKLASYSGLAAGTSVFSLFDWFPTDGSQYLATLSSQGKLYFSTAGDTQANRNEITPLGASQPVTAVFVECGGSAAITVDSNKLLAIFTGTGPPNFIQGISDDANTLTQSPTDWATSYPVNGVVHNSRLIAFGNLNKPHTVYGSTINDHQDFRTGVETGNASASSATYTHIAPGVGSRLYCGFSHKGMLFLLKYPRGVFYLDDTDINPTGWLSRMVTDAMGCAPSPFAGVMVDDGILFLSASGQFFLITASTDGGITVTDLSTRMQLDQWLQNNINTTRLGQVVSCWDPTLKIAYFALPSKRSGTSALTNDLLLSFDFRAFTRGEAKVRFAYSYRDLSQGLTIRRNPATRIYEPISADYSGNVWLLAQIDRSINSAFAGAVASLTGYRATFQLSHTDLVEYSDGRDTTLGPMNKVFDWLGIEYVPNTGGSITITPYVDGVAQSPIETELAQSGPRLATASGFTEFTIYSGSGSTVASELAGVGSTGLDLRVKWVRLTGSGRRISIQIQSGTTGAPTTASEDMSITALYLGYQKAGQDVGRGQGSS